MKCCSCQKQDLNANLFWSGLVGKQIFMLVWPNPSFIFISRASELMQSSCDAMQHFLTGYETCALHV